MLTSLNTLRKKSVLIQSNHKSGRKAVVVGAGFGGIASALRLRALGYEVELIERQTELGGRARVFRKDGFTYDAGPTVVTAPFLFEELFSLFGQDMRDMVNLRPLDPWYRICFTDGESFDYGGTVQDTLSEIERFNPADRDGYVHLLEMSRKIFDIGFDKLSDQPFLKISDLVAQIPHLLRLKSYRSVHSLVSKYIENPYLRKIFSVHPLLVGGNPMDTTSIYTLIHYLERKWGVHYSMGGMGAIVTALGRLMINQGIQIHLGRTVKKLHLKGDQISGVRLDDETFRKADIFVMNADPPFVYRHLLPADHQHWWTNLRIRQFKYSMGLFVLYFGTDRKYENIAHHTIWMGPRFEGLLKDIFHNKRLAEDFSLYIHRPTATDPEMAPKGCDGFYVLSPVPNLKSQIDWREVGNGYRDRIFKTLEQHLLPDLRQHLIHSFFTTPVDFKNDYLSVWGSGFSIAPLFYQSAWFRFHNRDPRIPNLYFVGAGTHPGAGVPGVLSSAKVLQNVLTANVN
jgi:phytoene desaturase